MQEEYIAPMNI